MNDATASPSTVWQRARRWWPGRGHDRGTANGICPSRPAELRAQLARIGPLAAEPIVLTGFPEPLHILHTANFQWLLDNAVYDPEQNYMPYWAEIWPSSIVLADVVSRNQEALRGQWTLELGPGVGVPSVAALKAGAELAVADYDAGSLALTALNGLLQTGREPRTLRVNWRTPTREIFKAAGEGFSVILASDVLYQRADARPLVELVEAILAPGGELWIAEPGREPAKKVIRALRWRGWPHQSESFPSPRPDPNYNTWDTITIHRLRRPVE
jgi:predicted nicotinamide N-methyase